jgi:hypothetical protein
MKTIKYSINIFVFVLVFCTSSYGTTKTFNVISGTWATAANWSPSGIPLSGDNVIIPAGRTITAIGGTTSRICATLQVNGSLSASGRPLTVTGAISGAASGTITVTAVIFTVGGGNFSGTITISSTANSVFLISPSKTFTNNGIINNSYIVQIDGALINNSTINNNNNIVINGALTNNGTYNERYLTQLGYTANATLNNNAGANFNIQSTGVSTGGQLSIGTSTYGHTGSFINSGTITNNSPDATYTGIFVDYGTLVNSGIFTNNAGAYVLNYYYGTITSSSGFTIINNGTFINYNYVYINGTFNNNGTYSELGITTVGYTSNGIFNNNASSTYAIDATYGLELWIGTSALITGTFNNYGALTNNKVNSNGIVVSYGTLINSGNITNNGGNWHFAGPTIIFDYFGLVINPNGIINNTGTINNTRSFEIWGGGVFNNNIGGIYMSSAYTCVTGSTSNAYFNNFGTYNENFENFLSSSGTASGILNNKSGGNVNISAGALICFSTTRGTLSNDAGGTVTNLGVSPGFPGLMLNVSGTILNNNGTIIDKGNILNNGTFTNNNLFDYYMATGSISGSHDFVYGGNGMLKYHGSIAQTTSHWEFPAFGVPFVTIDNSNASGVTLEANHSTSNLDLINGPLNLNLKTITITNEDITGITRTSGYILSNALDRDFYSKVQWNIGKSTGIHVFPFGINSSTYIPLSFELKLGGNIDNVAISTYPDPGTVAAVYLNRPAIVANLDGAAGTGNPGNAENIAKRFWRIEPTGTGSVDVTFTYAESEIPVTGEEANGMVAQRYNTSTNKWEAALPGQISNTTTNTVTVNGITNFSPWAISKKSNPLPVELLSFSAICYEGIATILWSTASETNNDFFTLQRSIDAREWETLDNIQGAGNSNVVTSYSYTDLSPYANTTYYRLKQTDFDGTQTESMTVWVNCIENDPNSFAFYNVTNDYNGNINVVFTYPKNGVNYALTIFDITGRSLMQKKGETITGLNQTNISLKNIPYGVYLISISDAEKVISKKLVNN